MKFAAILAMVLSISAISCNNSDQSAHITSTAATKRYHLKGKVVSVDQRAHMVNVDGEDIPGFMSAMTMPYKVKPETELDRLAPGESITADIVVEGDSSWLENIAITAKSADHK